MEIKWSKRNLKRSQATNTTRKTKHPPHWHGWKKFVASLLAHRNSFYPRCVVKGLLNVSDPHFTKTLGAVKQLVDTINSEPFTGIFVSELKCPNFFWLGIFHGEKKQSLLSQNKNQTTYGCFSPKKKWNSQELFQQPNFGRKKGGIERGSIPSMKIIHHWTHVLCIIKTNDVCFRLFKKSVIASSTNKKRLKCISSFPDPTLCRKSFSLHGKGIAWFLPLLGKSPLEKGYTCTFPGCFFLRDSNIETPLYYNIYI